MTLIQATLIAGVFSTQQKQVILKRLTHAMVDIEREPMRQTMWCMVEEVASGEARVGGQTVVANASRRRPVPPTEPSPSAKVDR